MCNNDKQLVRCERSQTKTKDRAHKLIDDPDCLFVMLFCENLEDGDVGMVSNTGNMEVIGVLLDTGNRIVADENDGNVVVKDDAQMELPYGSH